MPGPISAVRAGSAYAPSQDGREVMRAALRDIERRAARGERVVVVFDIDNTLVDTRGRTLAAARDFGAEYGVRELEAVKLDRVGLDGRSTAIAAGVRNTAVIASFAKYWTEFFFDGASYAHDSAISTSVQWAKAAKAAGAEVVYCTGRDVRSAAETRAQLKALGLPDVDGKHVICKPVGAKTAPYKVEEIAKLARSGHVAWFLTESERDIAAVQSGVRGVPCVVLEYPLGEAGDYRAAAGTPRLAYGDRP